MMIKCKVCKEILLRLGEVDKCINCFEVLNRIDTFLESEEGEKLIVQKLMARGDYLIEKYTSEELKQMRETLNQIAKDLDEMKERGEQFKIKLKESEIKWGDSKKKREKFLIEMQKMGYLKDD